MRTANEHYVVSANRKIRINIWEILSKSRDLLFIVCANYINWMSATTENAHRLGIWKRCREITVYQIQVPVHVMRVSFNLNSLTQLNDCFWQHCELYMLFDLCFNLSVYIKLRNGMVSDPWTGQSEKSHFWVQTLSGNKWNRGVFICMPFNPCPAENIYHELNMRNLKHAYSGETCCVFWCKIHSWNMPRA